MDDIAAGDLQTERELHEGNLSNILMADREAVAREFDRHMQRTHEIMRAFRERRTAEQSEPPNG